MAEMKTNVELVKLNVVAATPISVDISAFNVEQVNVYLTDARVPAVYLTDYTLSFLPGSDTYRDGFRLTPTASMLTKIGATGLPNLIYIRRISELTTEFSETDSFLRDRIVDEFDKTIQRMQEMNADVQSAVRVPVGESITLPSAAARAGKLLEFDEDGNPVTLVGSGGIGAAAAQVALDRIAVEAAKADTLTARDTAVSAAGAASTDRGLAQTARTDAQTARGGAETARSGAEAALADTLIVKTASETARGGAETARTGAETARTDTLTAKGLVDTAKASVDTQKAAVDTAKGQVDAAKASVDASLLAVRALYQGALAADPALDLAGVALTTKAYYFNTSTNKFRFYNGSAWQDNPVTSTASINEVGQCKLKYASAVSLRLDPFDGNQIMIDGTPRTIPQAGITLSNSGLTASTIYYIYASWSGSAIVLVASATVPVRRTDGVVARTGTLAQTLVGMAATNASTQFLDALAARHVRSWFNEDYVTAGMYSATQTANSGASFNELLSAHRVSLLMWPNEEINGTAGASGACNTASAAIRFGVGFNVTNASNTLSLTQVPVVALFNSMSVVVNERAGSGAAALNNMIPVVFTSAGIAEFAHVQQAYRTTRGNAYG